MARTDFSTQIDVQPPNPALLPAVNGTVSARFTDGLSNYRDRLERSLSQPPLVVTNRPAARVQPPESRQRRTAILSEKPASSDHVPTSSRRSAAQSTERIRNRRPVAQTAASPPIESTPRPKPAPDRQTSPTPRGNPKDNNPTASDATATSPAAKTNVEPAPVETAAQRTTSSETPATQGTPPVDLQLFTAAEVGATSQLASSQLPGAKDVPGSSAPSDNQPDTATDPASNGAPDTNVLIPPLGIFVPPNPADVANNGFAKSDTPTDSTDPQGGTTAEIGASSNGLIDSLGNVSPDGLQTASAALDSQPVVSTSGSDVASNGPLPDSLLPQPPTTIDPKHNTAAENASDQTGGPSFVDVPSSRSTSSIADGQSTPASESAATASAGTLTASVTEGTGQATIAIPRSRQGNDSHANKQTSATSGKSSDSASRAGQQQPLNVPVAAPLVPGIAGTPNVTSSPGETPQAGLSPTGSAAVDAGGSTAGGPGAPAVHPGSVATAAREAGPVQASNGPEAGRTAELVDRVATAVRSAHHSRRELRIRLTPPELGTVRIEISSRGGTLTARLEVETAAAQQTIQHNLSLLRDTLAQQGTQLQRIDVHLTPSRSEEGQPQSGGQQQSGTQQQPEQQQPRQQQQSSRQDSQTPQHSQDEENSGRTTRYRSSDELDIQV